MEERRTGIAQLRLALEKDEPQASSLSLEEVERVHPVWRVIQRPFEQIKDACITCSYDHGLGVPLLRLEAPKTEVSDAT